MNLETKKNLGRLFFCFSFLGCFFVIRILLSAEIPSDGVLLSFQGKPAQFTAKDGTKAELYASGKQVWVCFFPPGKKMYLFPCNRYFLTGKTPSGQDRGLVDDPTGFFFQDKDEKKAEFIVTTKSYGGESLDVFGWNGYFFTPQPFCPPHLLWGVKKVEREYSETLGQDYFSLDFINGQRDIYYVHNHYLVLGNDALLKVGEKPRTQDSDILELNSRVAKGDWEGALDSAKKNRSAKKVPGKREIISNRMLQAIDIEKGNYDEAVSDYFKKNDGTYNEKALAPESYAMSYESLGDQLIVSGKLAEAKGFYEKAIENYQSEIEGLNNMEASFLSVYKNLKSVPNLKPQQQITDEYAKQQKDSFAKSVEKENSNIDRVKQKTEMIDEQK